MASYEEALHLLRYRNWNSRSLLDRKFKLVCSELNGRYISNEFQVEVSAGSLRRPTHGRMLRATVVATPGSAHGCSLFQPESCCWSEVWGLGGQVMACLSPRAWGFGGSWLS